MVRSLPLVAFAMALLIVTACTGPTGPIGPEGPGGINGAPGEMGEPGAPGKDGAGFVDASNVDALAKALAGDPALREAVARILAEQHAEELRGPAGEKGEVGPMGVCDCGDGGAVAAPVCANACSTGDDCGAFQACVEGACLWVGCSDDDECQGVHGEGYVCVTP